MNSFLDGGLGSAQGVPNHEVSQVGVGQRYGDLTEGTQFFSMKVGYEWSSK